jgi:hypothetical protein
VKLIDSAVQGMMTLLQAQLPTKLTQIELEYNDGLPLDPPATYLDYQPADYEQPAFPMVCVLAGEMTFSADTGFGGGGWADSRSEIGIVALLEYSVPRDLSRSLLRYQRAIVEVVGANRVGVLDPSGATAWHGLSISKMIPGERFESARNPGAYVESTTILCLVTRTES